MNIDLQSYELFENRHNAPSASEIGQMLNAVGASSLDELIQETVPEGIRMQHPLNLPEPLTEAQFLASFKELASKNKVYKSYIGMGYHDCYTPTVVLRNILENPGWYTAYTPYQAEIAQGRLEMLINFQTMVSDLTGMELANSSLLDEGTAAAEAMSMLKAANKKKRKATTFFADKHCHPQTLALLKTRAKPMGINLQIGEWEKVDLTSDDLFGVLIQYGDTNGEIKNIAPFIEAAEENNVKVAVATDLLSLALFKSPGSMGADVVVGTAQRFGVPMGYGGPHAAFFATKEEYKRLIPGRIIGVSKDISGKPAYRMALQTREQHIKRERATSNICTAQVLLAVMAAAYGIYHGPEGLRRIALRTHGLAVLLSKALEKMGYSLEHTSFFDTLKVAVKEELPICTLALKREKNLRFFGSGHVGISMDETKTLADVKELIALFAEAAALEELPFDIDEMVQSVCLELPIGLERQTPFMEHPVFSKYHTEHEMLRYLKGLENKDLSLTHSMISLGSCTMKLNATTEMIPVTWPEFGSIHPFAPASQAEGYHELFSKLKSWLQEVTGFHAVSLQPNSGAQGEYAGLMVIRAYHKHRGEGHRNITLIPTSAHGTNPASAVMAGTKVVLVNCDEKGNIDLEDLRAKAEKHKENLFALMVTYPSTHGVFEASIREICQTIHDCGGRVYMDGANMNAQVGLTSPALIGADVCHLNLHKTFCIPHGGGGPGMGPIGVVEDLAPFLPSNPVVPSGGSHAVEAISAAPWGSASILTISYAYIAMMGGEGLTNATKLAILNANYIKERLDSHYPVLYTGENGRAAHEMIIDCRAFKKVGIEVEDIAKRLMDYGFHAPTVSFPVPGTLMIEPTESETKEELDRFANAMIGIREEIAELEAGNADPVYNVLKQAPHTAEMLLASNWEMPYSREKAAYPLEEVKERKFWPSVRRIDSAFGDRNLMCSCVPVDAYAEEEALA